jgi:hypothetical protein
MKVRVLLILMCATLVLSSNALAGDYDQLFKNIGNQLLTNVTNNAERATEQRTNQAIDNTVKVVTGPAGNQTFFGQIFQQSGQIVGNGTKGAVNQQIDYSQLFQKK